MPQVLQKKFGPVDVESLISSMSSRAVDPHTPPASELAVTMIAGGHYFLPLIVILVIMRSGNNLRLDRPVLFRSFNLMLMPAKANLFG